MDLRHVSSRELAGQELKGYDKRKIIYENLSPEDAIELDKSGKVDGAVIVDLSADYRFDASWTYALPELTKRSAICQSTRISNPGCYATGFRLTLAPMLEHLGGVPCIFGVSGNSGAGTRPSPNNDLNRLKDNLVPYSLIGHIYEREISRHLGTPVAFIPHVASWFRGIYLTINIPLNKTMTSRDIRYIY
ncbi:unnamed protein product [Clonostachys solani]|uniref:N-acetyl-gamma-glutamyl-phosphate reductase dimerisation domain-containing protein n=1 Tax=Clonostachys solani TaxID=160281 RepID=A0A9N9Z4R1_9HYPO|nr:unnamed protein product [Clonostachys solani]